MHRKLGFALLFLMLIVTGQSAAQNSFADKPKLVVRVVVEQMRYEMLLRYWDSFEKDAGFQKLVDQGTLCTNTRLNYALTDRAPGFATLTTGANPSVHGMVSDYWYNRVSDRNVFCIDDKDYETVGAHITQKGYSPSYLLSGTLGDELKMMDPRSKVFSLSLNPVSSILGNGNVSDGAFWFEDKTGNWITSSYYIDSIPKWVRDFNDKGLQDIYMNRQWRKLVPDTNYTHSLPDDNADEEGFMLIFQNHFPYNLSHLRNKSRSFKYLKYTPFGNTYTKDFAHALILSEQLGQDRHTDLLTISFASSSYVEDIFGARSIEMEDLYIRLDRQLKHLLSFLEEKVGKDNFLLVLTADRGCNDPYGYRKLHNLPAREFKPEHGFTLMESYLDIVFERDNWIKAYVKRQLYLDHGMIDQKGYDLNKVQETVSTFMVKKAGITYALKSSTLREGGFSEGIHNKFQNSYHPKRSGDILLGLEPGSIENNGGSGSSYNYDGHIPLIWYGKGISPGKIRRTIDLRDVAPTMSLMMGIPFPEAANGKPILELMK